MFFSFKAAQLKRNTTAGGAAIKQGWVFVKITRWEKG